MIGLLNLTRDQNTTAIYGVTASNAGLMGDINSMSQIQLSAERGVFRGEGSDSRHGSGQYVSYSNDISANGYSGQIYYPEYTPQRGKSKTQKAKDQHEHSFGSYEILNHKRETEGFGIWDSTIILTSRAIGTGFLFFPSHQHWAPFIVSILLIIFNFASGFYSSIVILEIRCALKDFSTFQELAYFLGGGRASIFFISSIVILTFALYPAYYFQLIGRLLWQVYWRIFSMNHIGKPKHYDDFSVIRALTLLASVILIYFCYTYRFKQFKATARAIAIMSSTIFILIISFFPFIVPAVKEAQDKPKQGMMPFSNTTEAKCTFMPVGIKLEQPDEYEQWRSIMLLFPAISFAFSFECSVLPVHQASRKRDPTGKRSYTACVRCLTIVFVYYSLLMVHSVIYGEGILEPQLANPLYKLCTRLYNVSIIEIVQALDYNDELQANGQLGTNYLAMILMICFTIQSILQLLYTFYECRTHIKILVKELLYYETSLHVEAVKKKQLHELRNSDSVTGRGGVSNDDDTRDMEEYERMLWMRMKEVRKESQYKHEPQYIQEARKAKNNDVDNFSFMCLFTFNICLATVPIEKITTYISNVCGSSTVPFLQFALPGMLYYLYLRKCGETERLQQYNSIIRDGGVRGFRYTMKKFIFGKTFSVLFMSIGFIQIFTFLQIIIYGFFV
ncbi:hypothetical protein FGO68_gene8897 [Halteria grandinella]|uniref:Amino acid transporter n=1 Tax=Halteria grandinella TaxID=5974 RepID=A0A8J8NYX6_HALGN|nr:hypothetical protein FGO68_gene8897 [Halteria grandinella]